MSLNFEELDYCKTRLGELSLRRRRFPRLGEKDVYEVKLDDEFLMSSLFTEAETALARLGLEPLSQRASFDVLVGGLGLGYTAAAALEYHNLRSLLVIEALAPVIDWHEKKLLPVAEKLVDDERCCLAEGDFFCMAAPGSDGFDPASPGRCFDAILLDIDHSPRDRLHMSHDSFYQPAGLEPLLDYLRPGGVFALWSNDPPDEGFIRTLTPMFADIKAHVVTFDNPLQGRQSTNTVYVASLN